jgi:protein tyrosine phosphatase (PTP) superfamily phosphohydrolase (DUF442 family)
MSQGSRFKKIVADAKSRVAEVSPQEAVERQKAGAQLIDVREADEFANGHAQGAAHLSKGVLELKIEQAVPDADTPIVCYCGGGSRSCSGWATRTWRPWPAGSRPGRKPGWEPRRDRPGQMRVSSSANHDRRYRFQPDNRSSRYAPSR